MLCSAQSNSTVWLRSSVKSAYLWQYFRKVALLRKTVWSLSKRPWSSTKVKCCWPLPARSLKATRIERVKYTIYYQTTCNSSSSCSASALSPAGLSSTEIRLRASPFNGSGAFLYQGTAGNRWQRCLKWRFMEQYLAWLGRIVMATLVCDL